jgi:transposase
MNSNNDQIFINRLNQHPELRERMESLLNVVENAAGDCTKADDAEQHVIEELRKMGNEALHSWANKAASKSAEALCNQEVKLYRNGKKKSAGTQPSGKSQF